MLSIAWPIFSYFLKAKIAVYEANYKTFFFNFKGRLFKVLASLSCFVMLVLFVAEAKILAVKVGIYLDFVCLPCQPACLVLAK